MSRVELVGLILIVTSTACGPGRLTAEATGETVASTDEGEGEGEGEVDVDEGEVDGWEFEGEVDDDDDTGDGDWETGDSDTGDGDPDGAPNGATCVRNFECASQNCYSIPFLGGFCGQCNSDDDCPDGGCTQPNPFTYEGSTCNVGELGGGCESDDACMPGLQCGTAFDLLGLIQLNTCGECLGDGDCLDGQICAPLVDIPSWSGVLVCMSPGSLMQDAYCDLAADGDLACASGICSTIDVMGIAEIGACGECKIDADCPVGTCVPGQFAVEDGKLTGSTCLAP